MSKRLRIFNLTDVETPVLKQFGLTQTTIAVGRILIPPGGAVATEADALTLEHLHHFIEKGALAVDVLPPPYIMAKERRELVPAPVKVETYVPFKRKKTGG